MTRGYARGLAPASSRSIDGLAIALRGSASELERLLLGDLAGAAARAKPVRERV